MIFDKLLVVLTVFIMSGNFLVYSDNPGKKNESVTVEFEDGYKVDFFTIDCSDVRDFEKKMNGVLDLSKIGKDLVIDQFQRVLLGRKAVRDKKKDEDKTNELLNKDRDYYNLNDKKQWYYQGK